MAGEKCDERNRAEDERAKVGRLEENDGGSEARGARRVTYSDKSHGYGVLARIRARVYT